MRSQIEIMNRAKAETFTKADAQAIVKEQVDEMVNVLGYTEAEARRITLANIGYITGYYPAELADKVFELFETEHPYFGKKHPTPEEISKMVIEHGRRIREQAQKETN